MITINDLLNEYDIKYNYLPESLRNIVVHGDLTDYTNGEKVNGKIIFHAIIETELSNEHSKNLPVKKGDEKIIDLLKNKKDIIPEKINIVNESEIIINVKNLNLDNVRLLEPYITGDMDLPDTKEFKELYSQELNSLTSTAVIIQGSVNKVNYKEEYNVYGGLLTH